MKNKLFQLNNKKKMQEMKKAIKTNVYQLIINYTNKLSEIGISQPDLKQ